jgi:hypothetical protein
MNNNIFTVITIFEHFSPHTLFKSWENNQDIQGHFCMKQLGEGDVIVFHENASYFGKQTIKSKTPS